jgi:hypothetical protein
MGPWALAIPSYSFSFCYENRNKTNLTGAFVAKFDGTWKIISEHQMEMMEITVLRAALETPHNNVGIDILALQ